MNVNQKGTSHKYKHKFINSIILLSYTRHNDVHVQYKGATPKYRLLKLHERSQKSTKIIITDLRRNSAVDIITMYNIKIYSNLLQNRGDTINV